MAPVPAETHRQIAREFTEALNLEDAEKHQLIAVTEQDQAWWIQFGKSLKERSVQGWHEARRKSLLKHLDQALVDAGMEEDPRKEALEHVRRSARPNRQRKQQKSTATPSGPSQSSARELLHLVVNELPDEDLGKMWVPFGAVLAALTQQRGSKQS